MNADMSSDSRRAASTTADRNDDDDVPGRHRNDHDHSNDSPTDPVRWLVRSGHDAGSQALALASMHNG